MDVDGTNSVFSTTGSNKTGLTYLTAAMLICSLLSGSADSEERPTAAQVRQLLEFEQALLSRNEGWDYLLGPVNTSGDISRHVLLTRESRLPDTMLVDLVRNSKRSTWLRTLGLRYLSPVSLQREWIEDCLHSDDRALRREAILSLQASTARWGDGLLRKIAADPQTSIDLRAEAVLGLAARVDQPLNTRLLLQLARAGNPVVQTESLRALRGQAVQNGTVRNALLQQIEADHRDEIEEQLVWALAGVDDRRLKPLQLLRARVVGPCLVSCLVHICNILP